MVSKVKPKADEQYNLLDVEPAKDQTKAGNGNAGFNDPAFASNKLLPVHRWVPWIAGFASEFVRDTFNRYLSRSGTILDPVGTTLVEALLAGHDTIGFEINPSAALACSAKTNYCQLDGQALTDKENQLACQERHEREAHARHLEMPARVQRSTAITCTKTDFLSKADKGYSSGPDETTILEQTGVGIVPIRRKNIKPNEWADEMQLRRYRKGIETVNSQLEKRGVQHLHACSSEGFEIKAQASLMALACTNLYQQSR